MSVALETRNLSKWFGGIAAADDVSLSLKPGARHALIGPNGAGKTTILRLITGELSPDSGSVLLNGHDVTALPQPWRARRGLVRSFQITSVFASFSVFENIALAVAERREQALSLFPTRGFSPDVADETEEIAATVGLHAVGSKPVRHLAYGEQRLVDLALALALRPHVLLLDEPAAGLTVADGRLLLRALNALPADVAVLLIEHDMRLVFDFAQAITVLAAGRRLASGTPDDIRADSRVRAAYLGTRHG